MCTSPRLTCSSTSSLSKYNVYHRFVVDWWKRRGNISQAPISSSVSPIRSYTLSCRLRFSMVTSKAAVSFHTGLEPTAAFDTCLPMYSFFSNCKTAYGCESVCDATSRSRPSIISTLRHPRADPVFRVTSFGSGRCFGGGNLIRKSDVSLDIVGSMLWPNVDI